MITIICFGKIKEKYLTEAINDYLARIKKYHNIRIVELKDCVNINDEEKSVLKLINPNSYNIVLDINGKSVSSVDFANSIDKFFNYYAEITFIIGSSNGLSDKVKRSVNEVISFGDITMPHGIFRLVLLEQIYRSFKINNNETYHK